MAETLAQSIMRRQAQLESDRAIFEEHWREVAERVFPRSNHFNVTRSPGERLDEKVFDSTAVLALERFAAAMESMLTPRTQRWHTLRTTDEALNEDPEVKAYLEQTTKILFAVRYSSGANFASQANEHYMSLGAFGTGSLFIDELIGRGIRYRSIHLGECYYAENHQGIVDTIFRKFQMTARQAIQRFGDRVPGKIREVAQQHPERAFDFIHAVMPNEDLQPGRLDRRGMPFTSCYVSCEGETVVREGGYRTMPYAVGRYVTSPKEIYGRSPAMTALADIKTVNEQSKTLLKAAHKAVDPPLLLHEDGALQPFSLRPGALNYGGVDDNGRALAIPLQTGARVDIGLEMMDQRRRTINDAFLVTLFQILVEAPQMTATEAMLRAQEKGALLAPTMGRQQSEFLGPLIERELDILGRAGLLPPMPDALLERGGEVEIEYSSPLTRAQRADEGVAILRTFEQITPLAQVDPSVLQAFDLPGIAMELADINGMPQKLKRTREQLAAAQQQQAQQQQAAQLLEAAPVVGKTVKDLAQAQSLAAAAPTQVAPGIFG